MNHKLGVCLAACLAAGFPTLSVAAPQFVERQIVVKGNQNFDVTGINDHAMMVGTLYAAKSGVPSGVILRRRSVTTIPAPYSNGGPAQPTSIYDDGTVIGTVQTNIGGHEMFLLRAGAVDPNYQIPLDSGSPFGILGVNPIGLVREKVFFTRVISKDVPNIAMYGKPPHFRTVPHLDRFTTIKGLSASGMVSGTAFQEMGPQNVFLGKGNQFQFIAPPGAVSASGGVSNVAGEVAGSWVDPGNVTRGFTYNAGQYTTFDMPDSASRVVTTAINRKGWVVGTYVSSANGKQHAFFYDGTHVTSIGTYEPTANLSANLNNIGQMVIAEQFYDPTPTFNSFLETCLAGSC